MKKFATVVTSLFLVITAALGCASSAPSPAHPEATACAPRGGLEVKLVSATGEGEHLAAWSGDGMIVEPTPWIGSADVEHIEIVHEAGRPLPSLSVRLREEARARFERLTGENVGRKAAIVVDGRVASALTIRDAIHSSALSVTGASQADVDSLTHALCN